MRSGGSRDPASADGRLVGRRSLQLRCLTRQGGAEHAGARVPHPSVLREASCLLSPSLDLGPQPDAVLADDDDGLREVGVPPHEVVHGSDVCKGQTVGDLARSDQIIDVNLSPHVSSR
jgi:hypothetical protein